MPNEMTRKIQIGGRIPVHRLILFLTKDTVHKAFYGRASAKKVPQVINVKTVALHCLTVPEIVLFRETSLSDYLGGYRLMDRFFAIRNRFCLEMSPQ